MGSKRLLSEEIMSYTYTHTLHLVGPYTGSESFPPHDRRAFREIGSVPLSFLPHLKIALDLDNLGV